MPNYEKFCILMQELLPCQTVKHDSKCILALGHNFLSFIKPLCLIRLGDISHGSLHFPHSIIFHVNNKWALKKHIREEIQQIELRLSKFHSLLENRKTASTLFLCAESQSECWIRFPLFGLANQKRLLPRPVWKAAHRRYTHMVFDV